MHITFYIEAVLLEPGPIRKNILVDLTSTD